MNIHTGDRQLIPVIMAGGLGKRLWPLSREDNPKQFHTLIGKRSLLQQTVDRICNDSTLDIKNIVVVTNEQFAEETVHQLAEFSELHIDYILEPNLRNTAPALAAATIHINKKFPNAIISMIAADHHIELENEYCRLLKTCTRAAIGDHIITIGIKPDKLKTGYGYIKYKNNKSGLFPVEKFLEKPDKKTAAKFLKSGNYLWNSGIFVFSPKNLLAEFQKHQSETLKFVSCAYESSKTTFDTDRKNGAKNSTLSLNEYYYKQCQSISIDHAIMEPAGKSAKIKVVPANMGWSDLGAWNEVQKISKSFSIANQALKFDCKNTHIKSSQKNIIAIGLKNLIAVDTDDVLLLVHSDRTQDIGRVYTQLKANGNDLVKTSFGTKSLNQKINSNQRRIEDWLVKAALPFSAKTSIDRVNGGVFEQFDRNGQPKIDMVRRSHVLARQIYSFAYAGHHGLISDSEVLLTPFITYLTKQSCNMNSSWGHQFSKDGNLADPIPHSYDHAFILLALAWVYRCTHDPKILELISRTNNFIDANLLDSQSRGYLETSTSSRDRHSYSGLNEAQSIFSHHTQLGEKHSNTQIHMLEAFLAAFEGGCGSHYLAQAENIVALLTEKMFDDNHGAIPEVLSNHTHINTSKQAQFCEPGHQYEWAHLLLKYSKLKGVCNNTIVRRLYTFCETYAINSKTGLVYNIITLNGDVIDKSSRLWPQLERLRAMVAIHRHGLANLELKIENTIQDIFNFYLNSAPLGLWEDEIDKNGELLSDHIPQSSFYHLITAFTEYLQLRKY